MARRRHTAMAAAALLVALTACDNTGDNPPSKPATASFPTDGVSGPVIPDPLDAKAFIANPCTSLTEDQQKKLNLGSGKAESTDWGITCAYRPLDGAHSVEVGYNTNQQGLSAPAQVKLPAGVRWVTDILDNYPAIAQYSVDDGEEPDNPPSCHYLVGLNDDEYFGVRVVSAEGGQECIVARQIATDVLSSIKQHR